jgi:hypothetical protein
MGSAARWRGAYGGEYLRVGLHLRARGGSRIDKGTSQTRARKDYIQEAVAADQNHHWHILVCSFYSMHVGVLDIGVSRSTSS